MFFKLIQAMRPKTLLTSFAPVSLGAALAFHRVGDIDWIYLALILLGALLIQVATNYYNDALDAEKGRDTKMRLGPVRHSGGDLRFLKTLKVLAKVCLGFSFLIGIVLSLKAGIVILFLGVPALFLAYLYTGTKWSLSVNGWADGFVILYFGIIPVWATEFILTGSGTWDALLIGLQCGILCEILLLINNLRDQEEDSLTGKQTLVVRFGRKFGLFLLALSILLPFSLNILWFNALIFRASWWSFLCLPFYVILFYKVYKTAPSVSYNRYLGLSSLLMLSFAILFSLGILSS